MKENQTVGATVKISRWFRTWITSSSWNTMEVFEKKQLLNISAYVSNIIKRNFLLKKLLSVFQITEGGVNFTHTETKVWLNLVQSIFEKSTKKLFFADQKISFKAPSEMIHFYRIFRHLPLFRMSTFIFLGILYTQFIQ